MALLTPSAVNSPCTGDDDVRVTEAGAVRMTETNQTRHVE